MHRALRTTLLSTLLLGGTASGLWWLREHQPTPPRKPPRELGPVPVETRTLELVSARHELRAFGTLRPWREARLAPQIAGRVERSLEGWRSGVQVSEGELLLLLDTSLLDQQVRAAEAALAEARATLEAAGVEVEFADSSLALARERLELAHSDEHRVEGLTESGSLSESRLEAARSARALVEMALDEAERRDRQAAVERTLAGTRVARAQASLELARERRLLAELRAPFDGVLGEPPPAVGSYLAPGVTVATVTDLAHMSLDLEVGEDQLAVLREGLTASISLPGRPGQTFTGSIAALGIRSDARTRAVRVEVELDNPFVGSSNGDGDVPASARALRTGQFAEARLLVRELDQALLLYRHEFIWRDGRATCFVAVERGGEFFVRLHQPVFGHALQDAAGDGAREVVAGLSVGECLIVAPLSRLQDGQECVLLESSAAEEHR